MTDAAAESLQRRTWRLLQPGEVELNGAIVHTDLSGQEDIEMHQATVEVGEIIDDHAVPDADTFVYSGVDDEEFASNQHQGLTVEGGEFVWECQQLLRDGSFDLVFYYEAAADHSAILDAIREAGYEVTGVRGDEPPGDSGRESGDGSDERPADPEDAGTA